MGKEEEIWRPVVGYEGIYEVSNYSNVRETNGEELPQYDNGANYMKVNLYDGSREYIYRLAAQAFPEICGEWFEGCYVDHIDTHPWNNYIGNLRVCTASGNMNNPLTREHVRQALKKKWENEEYRAKQISKMSSARIGVKFTKEHREAISRGKTGVKFSEEHRKHIGESKKGVFKGSKSVCAEKVLQFDMNHNFIKEWDCITTAAEALGISRGNITRNCKGKGKSCGGFIWEYKEGNGRAKANISPEARARLINAAKKKGKPVVQYDLNMNFINEYPSASEASRQTGIDQPGISACCLRKLQTCGGYRWVYKENVA